VLHCSNTSKKPLVSLDIQELLEGIQLVVSMLPTPRVPIYCSVSSTLPNVILVQNELGVFHSIMALLVDAVERTHDGHIELHIGNRTSYNYHGDSDSIQKCHYLHTEVKASASGMKTEEVIVSQWQYQTR
jgi:hypothetical protein